MLQGSSSHRVQVPSQLQYIIDYLCALPDETMLPRHKNVQDVLCAANMAMVVCGRAGDGAWTPASVNHNQPTLIFCFYNERGTPMKGAPVEQLKTRVALPSAHRTSGQGQARLRPEQNQPQEKQYRAGLRATHSAGGCSAGDRQAAVSYKQQDQQSRWFACSNLFVSTCSECSHNISHAGLWK